MELGSDYTSLMLLVSALIAIVGLIEQVVKRRGESRAAEGEAHVAEQARPAQVGSPTRAVAEPFMPPEPAQAAPPAAPVPPARQAPRCESVTVVLRRQVPLRDAPPRSWLGGLPMIPDRAHIAFPCRTLIRQPAAIGQGLSGRVSRSCSHLRARAALRPARR